jgi:hypothetical protein
MSNKIDIPIWPGSSSFSSGSTPFGFYDNDYDFQVDADKFALFASRRLGYPIMDVELQDINFYTALEEAITTYGNEVYSFRLRDNYLSIEGLETGSFNNDSIVTPSLGNVIRMSQQYGAEAGAGGNITWYDGNIETSVHQQEYDLAKWAEDNNIEGGIEIKRIFHTNPPAITRYFDPYSGVGYGHNGMMDSFGWGKYSPAVKFLMMPLSFDIQRIQAIELNDQIRRSTFSFELVNNKLKLFPIPQTEMNVWFQYIKLRDRYDGTIKSLPNSISNISNVPYTNPVYSYINSIGRKWIFDYALAISKEMLGYVRGKYQTIPIPGSDTTLNHTELVNSAQKEKDALIERLRIYLDETSRKALLERRKEESENQSSEINRIPLQIYIA